MILPYVYKLEHTKTGEFYYGFRKANKVSSIDDLGPVYKTSSKFVKPRFDEFVPTVIAEFFNEKDAFWFEQELIKENWKDPKSLNKKYINNNGQAIFCGTKFNTPEQKAKISAKLKGVPKSEAHRIASGDAQRGKQLSEEHKAKLRKPKTVTSKRLEADSKIGCDVKCNRKISCIYCHKETALNYFSRHINCK